MLAARERLAKIPGVGAKTLEKLVAYFGGEEEALKAIERCKVSLLAEAVGAAAAARIIQGLYKAKFGKWPRDVAATEDAWRLFITARDVIAKNVASKIGHDILSCLLPLPSTALEEVRKRQKLVEAARGIVKSIGTENLKRLYSLLAGLEWPKPPPKRRIKRTLIVLGATPQECDGVREKLGSVVDVVCVEDVAQVDEVARDKGEALVYDPEGVYTGALPRVEAPLLSEVAPELIVEFYKLNWESIEKIVESVKLIGPNILEFAKTLGMHVDIERLLKAENALRAFRGGELSPEVDEEYGRLKRALERLERVVDEIETWVNSEMQSRLESLEVRLTAAQFLKLLSLIREGVGEGVDLPEEIYEAYEEIAEKAEKRLIEELGLTPDEAELVKGVIPRTPRFPVELDRERIAELRGLLRAKLERRRFDVLRELAAKLEGLEETIDALAYILGVLDVALAEAKLVEEGMATIPEVSREYLGIGVVEGLEASLVTRRDAQRVSYAVGLTPYKPDAIKGERVILLTGANSGGKTTLLKMLCEVSLLAQAGLVVYARRAWVGAFDSIHFFSKPTGMVDAGALEMTLRTLAAIVATRSERRLILVDELEAATEAGAAARIMAVVIEALCRDENVVAVIVTHLAREILAALGRSVEGCTRVDGIEARGLDERYNLIVDRNPRYYHLASSTPELVVRKLLYRSRRKVEREFYSRLLEALASRRE